MKVLIRPKGFAAYIAITTGQSGIVTHDAIEFVIENENEIEALECAYAVSEFNRFNQIVMTYGNQQRKLKSKMKEAS
jgi:hypothetical protein